MSFLIGFAIGCVIGWVVFKRPQWASDLTQWVKTKIGG